jgi:hypothetical protein
LLDMLFGWLSILGGVFFLLLAILGAYREGASGSGVCAGGVGIGTLSLGVRIVKSGLACG